MPQCREQKRSTSAVWVSCECPLWVSTRRFPQRTRGAPHSPAVVKERPRVVVGAEAYRWSGLSRVLCETHDQGVSRISLPEHAHVTGIPCIKCAVVRANGQRPLGHCCRTRRGKTRGLRQGAATHTDHQGDFEFRDKSAAVDAQDLT